MNMTESLQNERGGEACPGEQLAAARQQKGWSPEYVANCLHLKVCVIEQLEADEYTMFPPFVFVQGYVRAYAKLLELDPEVLVGQYAFLKTPEKQVERILRQRQRERGPLYREGLWRLAVIVALVAVLFGTYYWWEHRDAWPSTVKQAQPKLTQSTQGLGRDTLIDLSNMESTHSQTLPTATIDKTEHLS